MRFLIFAFVVCTLLAVAFVISQVLIPLFTNTKLFPAFSAKRKELETKLTEANEAASITRLKERIKKCEMNTNQKLPPAKFGQSLP